MKNCITAVSLTYLAASILLAGGCDNKPGPVAKPATPAHSDGDGHDHAAGEHEHDHGAEGPHAGQLIELGDEEYHAELAHDDAAHRVSIYILDSSAKNAVPIDQQELAVNITVAGKPQQHKLPAAPLDTDPPGQSSRFEAVNEELVEALDQEGATGRINVSIAGKTYLGTIEAHSHEGHDHEAHDHEGHEHEGHEHDESGEHKF